MITLLALQRDPAWHTLASAIHGDYGAATMASICRLPIVPVVAASVLAVVASLTLMSCSARTEPDKTAAPSSQPTTKPPFSTICATCHGQRGEGNDRLKTPSIAGLPTWYVSMQLEKFRSHQRGADALDVSGKLMHAIAQTLTSADITTVAEIVAALPPHPTRITMGGNPAQGRTIYQDGCIDCHRYNGSGEEAFRSAPLTGLQDWYLVAQLTKFRDGIRGTVPRDDDGAKMHLYTNGLTDEQFRDVSAYIAWLAARK